MTTTTTTTTTEDSAESLAESLGHYTPDALATFDLAAVPEEVRDNLANLIPPPAVVSAYLSRDIDGVSDLSTFGVALDERLNVLLAGPSGTAKTTAARAFAALHGLPFVAIPVNGAMDPGTVWGRYTVDESGGLVWVDSPAALVVRYGGVLVWDELNMAHPRILAAFHELLEVRRSVTVAEHGGEVIRAHPACMFFGTMNPGYEGTARLNPAMARRFGWPIEWNTLDSIEERLIPSPSLLSFAADVRSLGAVRSELSTDTLNTFVITAGRLGVRFAAGRMVDSFDSSERGGVRRALELHLPAIASDLGLSAPSAESPDETIPAV